MNQLQNLEKIPALAEVPQNQLQWILENGDCQEFEKGAYLFSKGDPIDKLIIVTQGKFSLKVEQNGEFKTIADVVEGEISGALPYSRATHASGYSIALQKSSIISLNKSFFPQMIREHHELTTALVHTMSTRVREFTTVQYQQEKLMSLGKLSAGLAHELNNPASALVRSTIELRRNMGEMLGKFKDMISMHPTEEQLDSLMKLLFHKIDSLNTPKKYALSDKAEMEDEIAEWLEDHGIEDGYDFAPVFVESDLDIKALQQFVNDLQGKDFSMLIEWVHNIMLSHSLIHEINNSASRISDLVSSIKSYTHMDRGTEMETVDISEGIDNTLKMLGHKLRQKQIQTELNFPDTIPKIKGKTGSLNQVWTNIIDNAIDAMDKEGNLKIIVESETDQLIVSIQDDGPGIPEDIQSKIFDPFFTTKKIGEGTGMGLDIVNRIIRNHRGEIKLHSVPGQTKFIFYFPLIR